MDQNEIEAATSAKFWDKIAAKYSRQPVADEAAYQQKLRMTQEVLRPDMDVLEIGCGTGSTALVHAPHVRSIRAVDVSENMLQIAREKAQAAQVANVSFEKGAFESLDAAEESLDAVLALSLLHLLDDPREAIRKVYGWLKPGGVFVTSTACLADTMGYLKYILPVVRFFGRAPKVTFLARDQLRQDHEDAGFVIEQEWQPGRNAAVFMIARKPAATAG